MLVFVLKLAVSLRMVWNFAFGAPEPTVFGFMVGSFTNKTMHLIIVHLALCFVVLPFSPSISLLPLIELTTFIIISSFLIVGLGLEI